LLCALTTFAVTYASPYRGTGRGIYTSTGYNNHSNSAQTHTATMGSTDSYYGMNTHCATTLTAVTSMSVQGFNTSASAITGGVTTCDAGHSHGIRITKTNGDDDDDDDDPPPQPSVCHCVWVEVSPGVFQCKYCGRTLVEGCDCDPCRCPLDMNWGVVLFMVAMAAVYAYIKKTDLTPNSDVRNGREMVA